MKWIVKATGEAAYIQVTASSDKAGSVRSDWVEIR
jgi:hypothetical protein